MLLATLASPLQAATELRLLIDVSGSMRQNDPRNLRIPALRLVNALLPAGSQAGVWLFAESTEVLIAPGTVDEAWKRQARARLGRIHSRGLHTNIELAIQTATAGWDVPTTNHERHLVLLTDGLVDVSKDAAESAASRERIATEQLARLVSLGIKVNIVALSDEVDMTLMRLLSTETGGWLETPKDADTLQRVFLRMLEQTATPTTVPLEGNRFKIDDQVSEFTLLAFRAEGDKTRLIGPDGQQISAEQLPKDATWRAESGYDLVTLAQPKPGNWQLEGVQDPDNRVVVVTDLDIAAAALATVLRAGQTPKIETWLTDHQRPVTRSDLLQLLTATATLSDIAEANQPGLGSSLTEPARFQELPMVLDPQSGRFTATLNTQTLAPGFYALQLLIDGGTFKRQRIERIKIAESAIRIEYDQQHPSDTDPTAAIILTLSGEPDLVDPASLSGYLRVQEPNGQDSIVEIEQAARLPLGFRILVQRPGDYRVTGQLLARTLSGDPIEIRPEPRTLSFDFAAPEADINAPDRVTDAPIAWLKLIAYLLGGNALLATLLGLTWWLAKRSKPTQTVAIPGQGNTKSTRS